MSEDEQYLSDNEMDLKEGDKVNLVIETETGLGYVVLINEEFEGLLFRSEVLLLYIQYTMHRFVRVQLALLHHFLYIIVIIISAQSPY